MEDTIELTLPVSGKKVVIRNYTTEADDDKAESILTLGVETKQEFGKNADLKRSISFPVANIMASEKSYIPRLVQSIDGDSSNVAFRLKELRSKDFAAVREAVEKIVEAESPKAMEARKASASTTTN